MLPQKISMTFEDTPEGKVKVSCTPEANIIFAGMKSGRRQTPAQSMAIMCLLRIMTESKEADQKSNLIQIPENYQV